MDEEEIKDFIIATRERGLRENAGDPTKRYYSDCISHYKAEKRFGELKPCDCRCAKYLGCLQFEEFAPTKMRVILNDSVSDLFHLEGWLYLPGQKPALIAPMGSSKVIAGIRELIDNSLPEETIANFLMRILEDIRMIKLYKIEDEWHDYHRKLALHLGHDGHLRLKIGRSRFTGKPFCATSSGWVWPDRWRPKT